MGIDLRLAVTDLVVGDIPIKIKCPDQIHRAKGGPVDKNSSLAVYFDHLHCFGCGYHENDWYDALGMLLGKSREEARAVADRYTSEAVDAYRDRVEVETLAEPLHPANAAIYHTILMTGPRKHRREWLHARGLTDETLGLHQIGHDGQRFVIPVWDDEGNLRTFRYRRDDDYLDEKYPKYCGMAKRNGLFLYPIPGDIEALDTLYICEGEFDALLMNQMRYPAITATNGAGQAHKLPAIIHEKWPRITHLIIATDQDEAGQEAARLTMQAATDLGFTSERLTWTAGKDVTDAVKLGFWPGR